MKKLLLARALPIATQAEGVSRKRLSATSLPYVEVSWPFGVPHSFCVREVSVEGSSALSGFSTHVLRFAFSVLRTELRSENADVSWLRFSCELALTMDACWAWYSGCCVLAALCVLSCVLVRAEPLQPRRVLCCVLKR